MHSLIQGDGGQARRLSQAAPMCEDHARILAMVHYGASKAGQLGFVRSAALELASAGITINAVLPGNIATEGLVALGPDYAASMTASIPLKRLGSVEDIANAVLFFATEEAGFITGQTLIVDGGQVLPESLAAIA